MIKKVKKPQEGLSGGTEASVVQPRWHGGDNGYIGLGDPCVISRKSLEGEGSRCAETLMAVGSWDAAVRTDGATSTEGAPMLLHPEVAAGAESACGGKEMAEQCLQLETHTMLAQGGS